jgi:hypothetical protein
MNAKPLKGLRIGILVLGWLLVAGVLAGIWSRFVFYYLLQNDSAGYFGGAATQFNLAASLNTFFSSLGNALLAFLVAAVFRMIERGTPEGNEYAGRLMIMCCLAYLADALTGLYSLILKLSGVFLFQDNGHSGLQFWLTCFSMAIPVLVRILYAASIFALYTHFTKMVTFESEVA